jgi:hypothetical protein
MCFCVLQFFRNGVNGKRKFRPSWWRGCEENHALLKGEGKRLKMNGAAFPRSGRRAEQTHEPLGLSNLPFM